MAEVMLPDSFRSKNNFRSLRIAVLDGDLCAAEAAVSLRLSLGDEALATPYCPVGNDYVKFHYLAKFLYSKEPFIRIDVVAQKKVLGTALVDLRPADANHCILCSNIPLTLAGAPVGRIFMRFEFGTDEPDRSKMLVLNSAPAELHDKSPVRLLQPEATAQYTSPSATVVRLANMKHEEVNRFKADVPWNAVRLHVTMGAQWPPNKVLCLKAVVGTTAYWSKSCQVDANGDVVVAQQFMLPFTRERQVFLFAAFRDNTVREVVGGVSCNLLELVGNGVVLCRMLLSVCNESNLPIGHLAVVCELMVDVGKSGCTRVASVFPTSPMMSRTAAALNTQRPATERGAERATERATERGADGVAEHYDRYDRYDRGSVRPVHKQFPASARSGGMSEATSPTSPSLSHRNFDINPAGSEFSYGLSAPSDWQSDYRSLNVLLLGCKGLPANVEQARVGVTLGHNCSTSPFFKNDGFGNQLVFMCLLGVAYGNQKLARVTLDAYTADGDHITCEGAVELQDVLLKRQIICDVVLFRKRDRCGRIRLAIEGARSAAEHAPCILPLSAAALVSSCSLGYLRFWKGASGAEPMATAGLWRSPSAGDGQYGSARRMIAALGSPRHLRQMRQIVAPCFCGSAPYGAQSLSAENLEEPSALEAQASLQSNLEQFHKTTTNFSPSIPGQHDMLDELDAQVGRAQAFELQVVNIRNVVDRHGVGTMNLQAVLRHGPDVMVSPVSGPTMGNADLGFVFRFPVCRWRLIFIELYDATVTMKLQLIGRTQIEVGEAIRALNTGNLFRPITRLLTDSGALCGLMFSDLSFTNAAPASFIRPVTASATDCSPRSRSHTTSDYMNPESYPATISISVGSAQGLPNPFGYPHGAYCVIKSQRVLLETQVVQNCQTVAVFNQRAQFPAVGNETVTFLIYGRHSFGGDRLLAQGEVSLVKMKHSEANRLELPLTVESQGVEVSARLGCSLTIEDSPTTVAEIRECPPEILVW